MLDLHAYYRKHVSVTCGCLNRCVPRLPHMRNNSVGFAMLPNLLIVKNFEEMLPIVIV